MSKYVGLLVGAVALSYWIIAWLRRPKIKDAKTIPTGVSPVSYLSIGIMLIFGPALVIFGGSCAVTELGHELNWAKTTGLVTDLTPAGMRKGQPAYFAQFSFEDSRKVSHLIVDSDAQTRPPAKGSRVNVIYDPSGPDHARINSFSSRWVNSFGPFALGLFFVFFAGGGALQVLRIQRLQKISRPSAQVRSIEGKFIKSKKNFFLSQKYRPSWCIVAEYRDLAGRTHVTESEPIWEQNPSLWAKPEVPVPLYVDRADPKRAWLRVQDYFSACK